MGLETRNYDELVDVLSPEQLEFLKENDRMGGELDHEQEERTRLMLYRLEHIDDFLGQCQGLVFEYFEEAKKEKSELTIEDFYRDLRGELVDYFSFYKEEKTYELSIEVHRRLDKIENKYSKIIHFGRKSPQEENL